MRESEINRRKMLLRALLLGSRDMEQAAAAAEALQRGGRQAEFIRVDFEEEIVSAVFKESWSPYRRENLPFVIDLCVGLRDEMRNLAAGVQRELQAARDRTVPPSVPPPSSETAD